MQVNCPNCGKKVAAENINIQKMTAVCSACDTVFSFELPEPKSKRRKVKQPVKLSLRDTENLHMEFWTNFKLERNESVIFSAFGGVTMMSLGSLLMGSEGDVPIFLPIGFVLLALALFYWLALIVVNKTHIEMDDDAIRVTRKPLPSLINRDYEVNLAGVTAIKYEETAISKKEAYDMPRYRVWAETEDGSRRTIVNDVVEEYAVFITQRLQERLHMNTEPNVSRLEDVVHEADDDADGYEAVETSRNSAK